MSKYNVIEKPDYISWDAIHDCLWESHAENRTNGMVMKTTLLSGQELKERITHDAIDYKVYVALDENNRVVGTTSVAIKMKKAWYVDGLVGYFLCQGILKECRGQGIYQQFCELRNQYVLNQNVKLVYFDTAEMNTSKQAIEAKKGFCYVSYFASESNHYSVVMAKWIKGKPISPLYCKMRFLYIKMKVRLKYKKGKIKRF